MIEATGLTKRYGTTLAVDHVTFSVRPGAVTGFLGPNGAGKSTTMRMVVGLDRPTSGTATVNRRPYASHAAPLHEVGVLLDAKAVHPGRSALAHLHALAATHGIPRRRVSDMIEMTGLSSVADHRVGTFSLGMGQRLGIAAAMLGDPHTLILDEPVNGLDPEGVKWVRTMVRGLAAEGRTVFLSSHLMSEMALTADDLIVIGRGHIIAAGPVSEIVDAAQGATVRVRSPRASEIADVVRGPDVTVSSSEPFTLQIRGVTAERIGQIAAAAGIVLHELTVVRPSLEDAFFSLTNSEVQYRAEAHAPALKGAAQ